MFSQKKTLFFSFITAIIIIIVFAVQNSDSLKNGFSEINTNSKEKDNTKNDDSKTKDTEKIEDINLSEDVSKYLKEVPKDIVNEKLPIPKDYSFFNDKDEIEVEFNSDLEDNAKFKQVTKKLSDKYYQTINYFEDYITQIIYLIDNDGIYVVFESDIGDKVHEFTSEELNKFDIQKKLIKLPLDDNGKNVIFNVKSPVEYIEADNVVKITEEYYNGKAESYYLDKIGLIFSRYVTDSGFVFTTQITNDSYDKLK